MKIVEISAKSVINIFLMALFKLSESKREMREWLSSFSYILVLYEITMPRKL